MAAMTRRGRTGMVHDCELHFPLVEGYTVLLFQRSLDATLPSTST
jgi:hypothetical protein